MGVHSSGKHELFYNKSACTLREFTKNPTIHSNEANDRQTHKTAKVKVSKYTKTVVSNMVQEPPGTITPKRLLLKCRLLDPTADLLNLILFLNKIPNDL